MKRIALYFTLIGVGAAVAVACDSGGGRAIGPASHNFRTAAAVLPDSVIVPLEEAQRMVENYAPRAGYVQRGGELLPNTRVAWVSLGYLEAIVDKLRSEDGDGIHIYLSAYDSVYTDKDLHVPPEEWWGYNTVLFTSTRDSVSEGRTYHRDYFTFDRQEVAGEQRSVARDGFIVAMSPMNRAGICPPPSADCKRNGALLLR